MKNSGRQWMRIVFMTVMVTTVLWAMSNHSVAENVTMTAVGEYVMGDHDTYTEAKRLALQDAKRVMLEKIGTYVESKTEVKNGIVSFDEIKQYTAGIVKVEEIGDERSVLANKATVVKVNVKATLDADAVIKQITSFRNRKDVEELAVKLNRENDRLRKEMDQMSRQLRIIANEKEFKQLRRQREEILDKIDANEKGLTLAISGEGLYAEAALDRQKKEEGKEKIKKFLREIAANYRLSASPPEIEDNGDGTANVTFDVKANIPVHSQPRISHGYVTEIAGVDIADFLSTGLNIQNNTTSNKEMDISCRNNKCKEIMAFMANEAKKLELFVKLGEFEKTENLAYRAKIVYKHQKKYNIRVSLSELKSLSQLQLKIVYDGQEYGQQKPSGRQDAASHSSWEETGANWFGITIKEDEPSYIIHFLINADSSFIITQVRAGSLADTAGLKEGDVIREINGKYLSSLRQYRDAILLGIQNKKIKFTIRRGIRYLPIAIGAVQQNEASTGGYKKSRKAKILY